MAGGHRGCEGAALRRPLNEGRGVIVVDEMEADDGDGRWKDKFVKCY